jgi:acetyltransferase
VKRGSHEVATRYCFIDYDREMTVVAEAVTEGSAQLIGVANLFCDQFRDSAEYALIIADQWHRRGLGMLMTEYCAQIAKGWGLSSVYAETTRGNVAMVTLFEKQGFEITGDDGDGSILLTKKLD